MTSLARPDTSAILAQLKDFQRTTVEHVFRRMYLDPDCTRRFLVADEVGLGKTLVARGLIAKTIDHLWDKTDRIDIVYLCSNGDIARQNVNRLNIYEKREFALASRITLLPVTMPELDQSRVNFISFTPGTSLEMTGNTGQASERVLLYHLLDRHWGLSRIKAKASIAFQGSSNIHRFREQLNAFNRTVDDRIAGCFFELLDRDTECDWRDRFESLCERLPRANAAISPELRAERNQMVGDLRRRLAQACLDWLEPDLIILDEFQRFKQLLTNDNEAAQLANLLFDYRASDSDPATAARVLLLSATPYKMYTRSHETASDDHYADFRQTLEFLNRDDDWGKGLQQDLAGFRRELLAISDGGPQRLLDARRALETRLRQVMVRTERLAVTEDRSGMLEHVPDTGRLEPGDVEQYVSLRRVANAVGHDDVLEYWKSSPYLLNFMDDYQLKHRFHDAVGERAQDAEFVDAVTSGAGGLLRRRDIERYRQLDPQNAKLRTLFTDLLDCGAWRLLWVPASRPYYRGEGPFADPQLAAFTKRLVFSSRRVVPKTIAALVSYEAERRMIRSHRPNARNTEEAREKLRPLLRFRVRNGQPAAMASMALFYPSRELAERFDPLRMCSEPLRNGRLANLALVLETARQRIDKRLQPLAAFQTTTDGPPDERWYWAAPVLFDLERDRNLGQTETRDWFAQPGLAGLWAGGEETPRDVGRGWQRHVDEVRAMAEGDANSRHLGRFPDDLARVLASVAIAGPANCAYRALVRSAGGTEPFQLLGLRNFAGATAFAFRHLFNLPEAMCLVRGLGSKGVPYWQAVLNYCAMGNLQAVLDEFVHLLVESEGLRDMSPDEAAKYLCLQMRECLQLRTSTVQSEVIRARRGRVTIDDPLRLRARFAMRFGDQDAEDGSVQTRADEVRAAFNSPFWPFVLATTSIGQEGLDFHLYCHAVTHWNLPSNPVDLEQREGRVHRYKGHALRKNLADEWVRTAGDAGVDRRDPWNAMFLSALERRTAEENDLQPFWVVPYGRHKIERHVPALPHSRDESHRDSLRQSMVLYRLVFGQNRQEDLVDYLARHLTPGEIDALLRDCRIDLSPQQRETAGSDC